ncbi:hypothetical protein B0H10DRAFT_1268191 [Mycena sp. CBHHK59/15]|nr:hypothetical protein B0H10DRAFT_1268191 [Mycena sp. CBHHK59/15]
MSGELELTVTITYTGAKARIASTAEAIPAILQDLKRLDIPRPRRSNVTVVFPGTVRFFWVAGADSQIHRDLVRQIRPKKSGAVAHNALLEGLSIDHISLRESIASEATIARQKEYAYGSRDIRHPDAGPRPTPIDVDSSRQFASRESMGTHQEDAKQILDQIASSQASSFNASRADSIASSFASGSRPKYGNQPPNVQIKSEPLAEVPIPPFVGNFNSPMNKNLKIPKTSHSTTPGATSGRYPGWGGGEEEMQIETPSPAPSRQLSGANLRIQRNRYTSIPDPRPRTPQDPSIQNLRRELWDVRRQLTADLAREMTILQNLKDLGADETASKSSSLGSDFASKALMQNLEAELQHERKERKRLELIVEDIRRECREPFVVPALLDAFVSISNLTTQSFEDG